MSEEYSWHVVADAGRRSGGAEVAPTASGATRPAPAPRKRPSPHSAHAQQTVQPGVSLRSQERSAPEQGRFALLVLLGLALAVAGVIAAQVMVIRGG